MSVLTSIDATFSELTKGEREKGREGERERGREEGREREKGVDRLKILYQSSCIITYSDAFLYPFLLSRWRWAWLVMLERTVHLETT